MPDFLQGKVQPIDIAMPDHHIDFARGGVCVAQGGYGTADQAGREEKAQQSGRVRPSGRPMIITNGVVATVATRCFAMSICIFVPGY